MNQIITKRINTPIGTFIAGIYNDSLCLFDFEDRKRIHEILQKKKELFNAQLIEGDHYIFDQLKREFSEYLDNERQEFTIPITIKGTEFQEKVWNELLKIPYGVTISYSELAGRINNPKAVRGVGKANGDNNIAIIIPCHRVIDKNGNLRGYGGGLRRKKKLLDIEMQSQLIDYFN